MSAFMRFYEDDGTSIEIGKSFRKEGGILFEIEGKYMEGSIILSNEDVHEMIGYLSSLIRDDVETE